MTYKAGTRTVTGDFAKASVAALACAALFSTAAGPDRLPVLDRIPLLPATLAAALLGLLLIPVIEARGLGPRGITAPRAKLLASLFGLAAVLTLAPIAIDVAFGFPQDLNLGLPWALAFYPAVALVAEVGVHLLPLAVLSLAPPGRMPVPVAYGIAALAEPALQAALSATAGPVTWLVFVHVLTISAAQLWLFRRYGFGAMLGLRLAYYLFWHILWGSVRLSLLF